MKYDKILKIIEDCNINVECDESNKIYNITIKIDNAEDIKIKYRAVQMIMTTLDNEIEMQYKTKYVIV